MSRLAFLGSSHVGVDTKGNLGGGISSEHITDAPILNKLFDGITGQQSYVGNYTDYRCFFIQNVSGKVMQDIKVYILTKQPDVTEVTLEIGVDPSGISVPALTIADEVTAPVGVTFLAGVGGVLETDGSTTLIDGKYLTIASLADGEYFPVWLKRHTDINRSSAQEVDGVTIQVMTSTLVG